MFLFLSKLLPLFIYPLGLTCLLLLIALITLRKRPRWARTAIVLALAVLMLSGNNWVVEAMTQSLERQNVPTQTLPKAEAIVVLGGGIKPQLPPRPWIDVAEGGDRPIYAAQLYREGKAPLVVLSGGRIEWQGGGPPESEDMAKLLDVLGVPRSAILEDRTSLNTYENAVNVKQILQARGIRRVLLVTSAMHMPRAIAIFRKQGIDAIPAPTDFLIAEPFSSAAQTSSEAIVLNLVPNTDSLYQFTRALKEYIGLVIYGLKGWL